MSTTVPLTGGERKLITAAALGTLFEWYDFFLYGSLGVVIATNFFSQYPSGARDVFVLAAFAAGFIIRPAGAFFFGRLGDRSGRKHTFTLTVLLMGFATVLVGILPGSETIGIAAPILLLLLRAMQGFALGGEYGGAAVYVAECAPRHRRGFATSFIQATATGGFLLSLIVIASVRGYYGEAAFTAWAWRLPFLLSLPLLLVSLYLRLAIRESPLFTEMRAAKQRSRHPIGETLKTWRYLRRVLLALFGLVMGQAVVWYGGQFYAFFFMTTTLRVDGYTASLLMIWGLALGLPSFILFGWLSDLVGRKWVIMAGLMLASATYFPIFAGLAALANPDLTSARDRVAVELRTDPVTCSTLFDPIGIARYTSGCDIARATLARMGVSYVQYTRPPGAGSAVEIGTNLRPSGSVGDMIIVVGRVSLDPLDPLFESKVRDVLGSERFNYPLIQTAGVVRMAHPFDVIGKPRVTGIITLLAVLVGFVGMVYGPIAAALAELFPTRIRYTAFSVPYHIGNGWFGGLLPPIVFSLGAQTGDLYFGLWYPVGAALLTAAICWLCYTETKGRDLREDMDAHTDIAGSEQPGPRSRTDRP